MTMDPASPIEVSAAGDYVRVTMGGTWTVEAARRIIDAAKAEAERRNVRRILFVVTEWEAPDREFTRFTSGEYLARVLPPPFRSAAVANLRDFNRFTETTAVNRGADFLAFTDEADAIAWLTSDV